MINLKPSEELRHFRAFAKQNRLKMTRDECNDPVIQGRYGNLSPVGHKIMACLLNKETPHAKKKLLKLCRGDADEVLAGFDQQWDWILSVKEPVCKVEGDNEAIFVFHPSDKEFLQSCLHHLGIKRKRDVSAATIRRLHRQGFQTQENRVKATL